MIKVLVYRVLRDIDKLRTNNYYQNEYKEYLKGIICTPSITHSHGYNTHEYKEGIEYMHFFKFKEDALSFINNSNKCYNKYVGEYNIPNNILYEYIGFGNYPNHFLNIPIMEFAIPISKLNNNYITNNIIPSNNFIKISKEYANYIDNYKNIINNVGINIWWNNKCLKKTLDNK